MVTVHLYRPFAVERFLAALIADGRLPDPGLYTLERACRDRPAD